MRPLQADSATTGRLTIQVSKTGYVTPAPTTLTLPPSRADLDFTLAPLSGNHATVSGTVRNQANQPVAGVGVCFYECNLGYCSCAYSTNRAVTELRWALLHHPAFRRLQGIPSKDLLHEQLLAAGDASAECHHPEVHRVTIRLSPSVGRLLDGRWRACLQTLGYPISTTAAEGV